MSRSRNAVFMALALAGTPKAVAAIQEPGEEPPSCGLEQRFGPGRPRCLGVGGVYAPVGGTGITVPLAVQPLALGLFVRSAYPMDRDNGRVWAGRGLSGELEGGVAGSFGPLRWAVYPSISWSQNADFVTADSALARYGPLAYPWEGALVDWPQRPGLGDVRSIHPGQSYIELGSARASVGFSTENLIWGPGVRYPLAFGVSAPGFPHAYANVLVPAGPAGAATLRLIAGRTEPSGASRPDTVNAPAFLSSLRIEWAPSGQGGLRIIATSIVTQDWTGLPDLAQLGELVPLTTAQQEKDRRIDGIGTLSFRLPVRRAGAVLFGTWGRGDWFKDSEDLLTEPDHNQFWSMGLTRSWSADGDSASLRLRVEYASTAGNPDQFGPRGQSTSVYRHVALHGHTHRGQLLGASIGPGARAGYVSLERIEAERSWGGLIERVHWDVDAFNRSIRAKWGRDAQDREWLFAGTARGPLKISGVETLQFAAMGGVSFRWNRQYVRFTGALTDYKERETNLWLDFRLVWTPGSADRP